MTDQISYRVGGKQPHNIYKITEDHPGGVPVGHACKPDPEMAARIVDALNCDQQLDEYIKANQQLARKLALAEDALADCRALLDKLAKTAVSGRLRDVSGDLVQRIDLLKEQS